MLNRLIERFGLRQIGLEGTFKKGGNINTTEYDPAALQIGQPIRPREQRLVALLERGQISNAEALALTYGTRILTVPHPPLRSPARTSRRHHRSD